MSLLGQQSSNVTVSLIQFHDKLAGSLHLVEQLSAGDGSPCGQSIAIVLGTLHAAFCPCNSILSLFSADLQLCGPQAISIDSQRLEDLSKRSVQDLWRCQGFLSFSSSTCEYVSSPPLSA